jgi:small GTP-binding protein
MGACGSKEPPKQNDEKIKIRNNNGLDKDQSKPIEAKLVLFGEQNVGKSSIAQRFCKNVFTGQHVATIGGAYQQQKVVLSNGQTIKYHIWDTGGQERFRSMGNLYYKDASAAILTYDITNEKSLDGLNYWIDELKNKCNTEKMVICLVGNKCDVENSERKVSKETGKSKQIFFICFYIYFIFLFIYFNF